MMCVAESNGAESLHVIRPVFLVTVLLTVSMPFAAVFHTAGPAITTASGAVTQAPLWAIWLWSLVAGLALWTLLNVVALAAVVLAIGTRMTGEEERNPNGAQIFRDKMGILGGGIYNAAHPHNTVADFGDVWCSRDGREWTCVLEHAPWPARRYHAALVFDDKLWILGGYHHGNLNDVWFSADGREWRQLEIPEPWPVRHEPAALVFPGRLWLLGGYGTRLYNDVWECSRGPR